LNTYPDTNRSIQEVCELKKKLEDDLAILIKDILKRKEELWIDFDTIPRLLQANDMKGAKEKVENLFHQFEAIEFLIKQRLPKEAEPQIALKKLEKEIYQKIDIYCKLFRCALDGEKKHLNLSKFPEEPSYEATDFMVFLVNRVHGEEDIITPTLVHQETTKASKAMIIPPETTKASKALIIGCLRRYVKETLGICISLVLKGEVKEAQDLFKNIVAHIKPSDIINRGRVYNSALRKAEKLHKVQKLLTSGCLSQRYKGVAENKNLLNWLRMEHDNQADIHTFFLDLFLQDEELMQKKDQLTFPWMEKHDYSHLIKCVCMCHDLQKRHNTDVFDNFKLCRNDIDPEDGLLDNWKEIQLYVEYALHSSASIAAGVDIIKKLFEVWPKLDVNAPYKGITALHVAVYKGHEEVVKVLFHVRELDINVRTARLITLDNIKEMFYDWPKLDSSALLKGEMVYKGVTTSRVATYKDYEDVVKKLMQDEELKIIPVDESTYKLGTKSIGGDFFQRNAHSGKKWNRNRWEMSTHQTSLHIATQEGHAKVVKLLCLQENLHREKMRYHEEDEAELTALDIIYKKLSSTKVDSDDYASLLEIENTLLSMEDVQKGIDRLYRYRQVLVDAANTILVGAALIAGVTFAGWLQPPLGYAQYYDFPTPPPAPLDTYDSYIGVQGNVGIQAFVLFNSLSFFLPLPLL
jgi:ankyrin repeat protein